MAAPSAAEIPAAAADGPVMNLMSKRLRALKKKYNRILQMEERVSQGKPLNKEQEEVLRSKPAVSVLIEEYEHLRQPLSSALQEELSLSPPRSSDPADSASLDATAVEDLLKLLYFGNLFDVKSQSEYETTMLMRTHERGCCITYDTVTDETTSLLEERDLDMISALGSLVLSRPSNSSVSHKNALSSCLEHSKLWLRNSDQPIQPGSSYTYASLREHLNKILASDYATATPEIKPSVELVAEVGKYAASHAQVVDFVAPAPAAVEDDISCDQYQHEGDDSDNSQKETGSNLPTPTDEMANDYSDASNSVEVVSAQQELDKLYVDGEEQNQRDGESMETHYVPRRAFQNQRGGNRNGGPRRGYPNGRGGRGGRGGGGFQNSRGGQYYDHGYYPRNYYNTRGRGGRTGGPATYNNHGTAGHGGHGPGVEMGAS